MAGDWQTTSERVIYDNDFVKKEENSEDVKSGGLNVGVRKRKFEGQEEEEEAGETVIRKGWGSTIRTYPGAEIDEDELNALLKSTKRTTKEGDGLQTQRSEQSSQLGQANGHAATKESKPGPTSPAIKKEESAGSSEAPDMILKQTALVDAPPESLKHEDSPPDSGVIFKKRKAKPIRQK